MAALGLRIDRKLLEQPVIEHAAARRGLTLAEERQELDRELDAIVKAASAQGWVVKTRSSTAFRVVSRNGQRYSLSLGSPADTRDRLRPFVRQLNEAGLRVSRPLMQPVEGGPSSSP